MKTDKELLELAAKAAGVQGHFVENFPEDGAPRHSCGIGNAGRITPLWNPLAYDGDALRLAVKLGIGQIHHQGWGQVMHPMFSDPLYFKYDSDIYAATRRAIVQCAAAIGVGLE